MVPKIIQQSKPLLLLGVAFTCIAMAFAIPQPVGLEGSPLEVSGHSMFAGFNPRTGKATGRAVEMTFHLNQTWVSSTGKVTSVPDQLSLSHLPIRSTVVASYVAESFSFAFHEYNSWSYFYAVVPTYPMGGIFTDISMLQDVTMQLKYNDTVYGMSQHWLTVYEAAMLPAYMLKPSPELQLAFEGLPQKAETKAELKRLSQFVTAQGTHYPCHGTYGGRVLQNTFLSKSLYMKYHRKLVAHEMSLDFWYKFFFLAGGLFHNRSTIHFHEWYVESAKSYDYWEGGLESLRSNATLKAWIDSVPDNANLLNRSFCPITELLPAPDLRTKTLAGFIAEYLHAN